MSKVLAMMAGAQVLTWVILGKPVKIIIKTNWGGTYFVPFLFNAKIMKMHGGRAKKILLKKIKSNK